MVAGDTGARQDVMKLNNKYYILRHGEALSNVKQVCSSWPEKFKNPLTKHGQEMVMAAAEMLKEKQIDMVVASPLLRAKQTAKIVAKELNTPLKFDKRLREIGFGVFNGKPYESFRSFFGNESEKAKKCPPRGECYQDVYDRVSDFLKEIQRNYKGKSILIVSHQATLVMLGWRIKRVTVARGMKMEGDEGAIRKGELREL
ncbi:MAG: hypothetical protein A2822_03855 [Candidatus Staskawiczbacteria bacterium RIFCSPHIGHO2_01_FULL_41_41]|uniref:Phosphoglycerate mutase n=1 Tax=Candidatus Staskawiczbacteria bacterium RIFCSPHIGHO2_01_FULL_41_41 TaxID=1802203 RepID=A0A1G2HRT2_9BACT|nr:MAG: hypothetical protein A2822_03855 [Candidatus Staskawiczbacteria bacterium RIFCSPHIGHO2_01_FULL_41_41]